MKHLLLVELDGVDCIANSLQRYRRANVFPGESKYYWRMLHDPELIASDEPVSGSQELLQYLAERSHWRVILLTQRLRQRDVYDATTQWLAAHGFDPYWCELAMREPRYTRTSPASWKALKVCWYAAEGAPSYEYQRIVFIDPLEARREHVLQEWQRLYDRPLDMYSGFTPFAHALALGAQGQELRSLLSLHDPDEYGDEELAHSGEAGALCGEEDMAYEDEEMPDEDGFEEDEDEQWREPARGKKKREKRNRSEKRSLKVSME